MAKVMISLPSDVLLRIDAAARERGLSRSALLREAAIREIGDSDAAELEAAVRRTRERARRLRGAPVESAALIREQRDELDRRDRSRR